ncbi:NADH:flavin oxidoreductase [Rubripirellula sp.]|jgi:NADPH2 dehydrogenase|nr:NADH:flavin oxidoreductase [Rubripirellula sp.]
MSYPRIASFKSAQQFTDRLKELDLSIPFDDEVIRGEDSPLADSLQWEGRKIGNRFCILPMEGWDGTSDGKPSALTYRRWRSFGASGAKLIWGGEAVAVRHDGRANPNQLLINEDNLGEIESLRIHLTDEHETVFGSSNDLLIGLQLTHSGRYAKPDKDTGPAPRPIRRNKVLDRRLGITDDAGFFSDEQLKSLVDEFIRASVQAEKIGFQFVDIKHCHGYLGHELLSGFDREGDFGGSFENRTRFLRDIVQGVRASTTNIGIGVRLSVFDFLPYCAGENGIGLPEVDASTSSYFGSDETGLGVDLNEPLKLMSLMDSLNVSLVCTTAGSPYYNPHIQRPAYFPPSDGYQPPEDPLVGVARQIQVTQELKARHPRLIFVGSGYSYLQDWLPNVAQAVVQEKWVDSVGLGRMVLSYPELPRDVLQGESTKRKKICRTFSDCTTAPRNGLVSGCYPLDDFYRTRPEREILKNL